MANEKTEDLSILNIVSAAYPGRGEETTVPIAFVLSGARWPRDYRANGYPFDERGEPLYLTESQEDFTGYLEWFVDYLSGITLEPATEQVGLCGYAARMAPDDAMFFLGMNAGIYHAELSVGAVTDPDCVAYAEIESAEKSRLWPDDSYMPPDAGYRVPLSVILRSVPDRDARLQLLRAFYAALIEYAWK